MVATDSKTKVKHDSSGQTITPLVLENVTVSCVKNNKILLKDINFQVKLGEHWLLLGPSGSGKSTLLQLVIGAIPKHIRLAIIGKILTFGEDNKNLTVAEISKSVGWLNQDPFVSLCLPMVKQNMTLALENKSVAIEVIEQQVRHALKDVGMLAYLNQKTLGLSGGESQKIALAALLVAKSSLLLLDEPTSMLDVGAITHLRQQFTAIWQDKNSSSILVEHRLDDLAGQTGLKGLPPNVLILNKQGEISLQGKTEQILIEHAKKLHTDGIWLPLECELYAHTGIKNGLRDKRNIDFLIGLSRHTQDTGCIHKKQGDLEHHCGFLASAHKACALRLDLTPNIKVDALTIKSYSAENAKVKTKAFKGNKHSDNTPELFDSLIDEKRLQEGKLSNKVIADNLSFAIYPGERVALLGKNGAGKTTLMMALASLINEKQGWTISSDITHKSVGMIFQNPEHQFVAQTVEEDIIYGLSSEIKKEVDVILEKFRLTHVAKLSPYKLSGGEKKRLSIAAMSLQDRDIFLVDEPTFGLDRLDTYMIMNTLKTMSEEGKSILFSSHDLRVVACYATRILYLDKAKIVADCTPYELFKDAQLCEALGIKVPELIAYLSCNFSQQEGVNILMHLDTINHE